MAEKKASLEDAVLARNSSQKDEILKLLREKGFRITKQRKLILDIVFSHECTCCKEIYYEALAKDSSIGIATVYRMINTLTDLGVFQTAVPYKNLYQGCGEAESGFCGYKIVLDNQKIIEFTDREWEQILKRVVEEKGYGNRKVCGFIMKQA